MIYSSSFMHLADAFIQSDLQCIQVIHIFVITRSLGIEPTTFALLTQCSNHWATGTHVRAMFIVTTSVKNINYEFSFWGKLQKIQIIKGVKGQSMSF